jgi:hypothetical protein
MRPYAVSPKNADPPGLGQNDAFFSLFVTSFSIGELIGAIGLGLLSSRTDNNHGLLVISFSIGLIGSVLYGSVVPPAVAIIGRTLIGVWTGSLATISRTWISLNIGSDRISFVMSVLGIFNCISIATSPGLNGLLAIINEGNSIFRLDAYRSPGWFTAILCVLGLAFAPLFIRANRNFEYSSLKQTICEMDMQNYRRPNEEYIWFDSSLVRKIRSLWDNNGVPNSVLWIVIFAFYTSSFGFTIVETMATPILSDHFGMDIKKSSILFVVGGSVSAVVFVVQSLILRKKWINERQLTVVAMALFALGALAMGDWQIFGDSGKCSGAENYESCIGTDPCVWNQRGPYGDCDTCARSCYDSRWSLMLWQLYVGFVLINAALPPGRVCTAAIYSQLLGQRKQGFMQGVLVGSGSISRILGPLIAVGLYESANKHTWLLMIFLILWFGGCGALTSVVYKKLDYRRYQDILL